MFARKRAARMALSFITVDPLVKTMSPRRRPPARPPDELEESLAHLLEVRLVGAADDEPADRPVRDDVRRGPPFDDDAVDARLRPQLLTPQPDRAEQQDQRVERIAPLSRGRWRACAWRPVNVTSTSSHARSMHARGRGRRGGRGAPRPGPSNRPSSSMDCLPEPRSSAGVPEEDDPPRTPGAPPPARSPRRPRWPPSVLWPQPWPSPGSASYSARMPIRGPSVPRPPASAPRTAVSRRPAGPRPRIRGAATPQRPSSRPHLLEGRLGVGVDPCDRSTIRRDGPPRPRQRAACRHRAPRRPGRRRAPPPGHRPEVAATMSGRRTPRPSRFFTASALIASRTPRLAAIAVTSAWSYGGDTSTMSIPASSTGRRSGGSPAAPRG